MGSWVWCFGVCIGDPSFKCGDFRCPMASGFRVVCRVGSGTAFKDKAIVDGGHIAPLSLLEESRFGGPKPKTL